MAVFFRLNFQTAPTGNAYVATRPANGLGDVTCDITQEAGIGVHWDFDHVTSGGYNNRAYCDYFWTGEDNQTRSGGWGVSFADFGTTGNATTNVWPATMYMRWRWRFPAGLINADTNPRTFKWGMIGGGGTPNNRLVLAINRASVHGGTNTTHVGFAMYRNITNEESCFVLLPISDWHHMQVKWTHGAINTARFDLYVNNNTEASPDASNLTFLDDWAETAGEQDDFYDGNPFQFCACTAADSIVSPTFNYQIMDLEVSDTFDATWFPGGTAPATPRYRSRALRLKG